MARETPLVLGVDTSNYTTSVCAVDAQSGRMVAEARRLLRVPSGERGLRQSEAAFQHVQHFPSVMAELADALGAGGVRPVWQRVSVSVRPRPWASSYMPVFQSGLAVAAALAQSLGVPLTRTSHQEGHLAAAEYFAPMPPAPFVAVHMSGGTCDVVLARRTPFGYAITRLGESLDLHPGQFVDRIGVALGLPFPAGPHLEELARQCGNSAGEWVLKSPVRGASMSFSGPLTAALRALEAGRPPHEVARAVEACIARAVAKAVEYALSHTPASRHVLIAGGVASNQFIQSAIQTRLARRVPGVSIAFAPPAFSRDNALGVAMIGFWRHHAE
ncbi:tRNA (adenosine(37)-N6)-threonylcarbamoyltransferase complex transferase subunit TsaD [Alicyclobacillus vulcanalis]|uniref:N(6)-L-threonylcarbamoyladenine synthase n=2 Tax=Alicyclobacillus TaxID=29330 RepID=A0A1N7KN68_9BACL|nr:peptidase M22 [Alicyclobacillus vulcanalis]SIS63018.1 N6-L-threonylcarbamoyladenine synthase [Alicyclobacillus vulcanalis]